MVSDQARRDLYQALEHSLGPEPATTMMELLPPVGWADVARRADLVAVRGEMAELRGELRAEMAGLRIELKGEMAELRAELKGEMAELRDELKGEMAELRAETAELRDELKGGIAELRSEVDQVRSSVDRQFVKLIAANVPMMFGTAALVLAAAKLA